MFNNKLSEAIMFLGRAIDELRGQQKEQLEWFRSHFKFATKHDLEQWKEQIEMKLSEIKAQIAEAAAKSTEAFAELGTRIGDLQKQIDDLILAAQDPDVTDEAFLADLNTVKTNAAALADIVPNAPTPPPGT